MKKLTIAFLLSGCVTPIQIEQKPWAPDEALISACADYQWKNRGPAPHSFVRGMAVAYSKVCHNVAEPLGAHDALSLYKLEPTMLNTYTLLIGLGMRESSGKYCEGADVSAGPEKPDEAEAGPFQFSYNSKGFSAKLPQIVGKYAEAPNECLLDIFSKDVSMSNPRAKFYCRPSTINGKLDSPEAKFQTLAKSCPAFSAEYAATLIRARREHFGPLVRQEAEVRPECKKLLEDSCPQ